MTEMSVSWATSLTRNPISPSSDAPWRPIRTGRVGSVARMIATRSWTQPRPSMGDAGRWNRSGSLPRLHAHTAGWSAHRRADRRQQLILRLQHQRRRRTRRRRSSRSTGEAEGDDLPSPAARAPTGRATTRVPSPGPLMWPVKSVTWTQQAVLGRDVAHGAEVVEPVGSHLVGRRLEALPQEKDPHVGEAQRVRSGRTRRAPRPGRSPPTSTSPCGGASS